MTRRDPIAFYLRWFFTGVAVGYVGWLVIGVAWLAVQPIVL